jgi:integrase
MAPDASLVPRADHFRMTVPARTNDRSFTHQGIEFVRQRYKPGDSWRIALRLERLDRQDSRWLYARQQDCKFKLHVGYWGSSGLRKPCRWPRQSSLVSPMRARLRHGLLQSYASRLSARNDRAVWPHHRFFRSALKGVRAVKRGQMPRKPDAYLLKDAATILIGNGLRPDEYFRLKWADNIRDGAIEIHSGAGRGSRRRIPASQRVLLVLEMRRVAMMTSTKQ